MAHFFLLGKSIAVTVGVDVSGGTGNVNRRTGASGAHSPLRDTPSGTFVQFRKLGDLALATTEAANDSLKKRIMSIPVHILFTLLAGCSRHPRAFPVRQIEEASER